jgi:hypothetical protein
VRVSFTSLRGAGFDWSGVTVVRNRQQVFEGRPASKPNPRADQT